MEKISLNEFFAKTGYDWTNDKPFLEKICYYTKTRVNTAIKDFALTYGMEQTFLIKAIAKYFNSECFFEMGTGRGTASYSMALNNNIKEILTVDIISHTQKQHTAIGHQPAFVSNKDIYELIPYSEKSKITFVERKDFTRTDEQNRLKSKFDICFIDGEHDNVRVITEDIALCRNVAKPDAILLFDDYCTNKFSVKKIVDSFLANNKEYNALLIEMRGHLFDQDKKEKDEGLVIMSTRSIL